MPATGLLDRAAELAAIAAAVRSASAGAGSALLVEGEAGIGKTSLLAQATPMCPTCAG
jgi:predicted ATPase